MARRLTRRQMLNWIKSDTGATLALDGEKKSDGPFRRRRIANQTETMPDLVHPLKEWLKWEVYSYLRAHNLPIPDAGRGDTGCVCLMDVEILHLAKQHPEDYELLKSFYPYIESVVLREEWFGGADAEKPPKVRRRKRARAAA